MTDDLKPYPAYKDTDVSWLPSIPSSWHLEPALAMFQPRQVKNTGLIEKTVLSLSYGRIIVKPEEKLHGLVPESFETYQIVDPGDIIVRTTDLQNDRTSLRIGIARNRGIITSAYLNLRAREGISSEYAYQVLNAYDLMKVIYGYGSGLRQNLDFVHIKRMPVPIPSEKEQLAIVRYLDRANQKINRYIHAKKKLIGLLNEQKQGIIHHAVTRGLDPNVKLKPSGLEWLGNVPEGWTLKRFKFVAKVSSGQVDPRKSEHMGKVLIAPNHIRSGSGKILFQETAQEQGADSGKYEVISGQIIYSKIRPNLRKAAIATCDCLCSADMYPLTLKPELRTEFMLQLLISAPFTKYVVDCSLRVAMPKVNREALGEAWVWYPGLQEQDDILEFIAKAAGPIDRAITHAEKEIDLSLEYRSRLVSDIATGKLDVRAAAAKLPDLTPKAEPLDEIDEVLQDEPAAEDFEVAEAA